MNECNIVECCDISYKQYFEIKKKTFYVMIILKQTSNRHFAIILEMCYDNDISYEFSKCYLIAIIKRNIYVMIILKKNIRHFANS